MELLDKYKKHKTQNGHAFWNETVNKLYIKIAQYIIQEYVVYWAI